MLCPASELNQAANAAIEGQPAAFRELIAQGRLEQSERAILGQPFLLLPTYLYRCAIFGATIDEAIWQLLASEKCLDLALNPMNGFTLAHGLAGRNVSTADFFKALADQGVDLDQRCHGGFAPLNHAAVRDSGMSIAALLEAGANPNTSTRPDQLTTAHLLAATDEEWGYQCILELHRYGADLTLMDAQGMTPLFIAQTTGNAEILRGLADCGVTE